MSLSWAARRPGSRAGIRRGGPPLNAWIVASIVFVAVTGAGLCGAWLRTVLPRHHLTEETKDMVKVGIGFLATLAALVLGLLVASAKSSFDTKSDEIQQAATRIILLDSALRQYGPAADPIRAKLRAAVAANVDLAWIERTSVSMRTAATLPAGVDDVHAMLLALAPATPSQEHALTHALQLAHEIALTRWMLVQQTDSTIRLPFLVVLVFWIAMIALGISLFAPRNGTLTAVSIVCSLSVASAIFLIIEMDQPFHGLLQISSTPLRTAIATLGR
jgi:hypothetical protein